MTEEANHGLFLLDKVAGIRLPFFSTKFEESRHMWMTYSASYSFRTQPPQVSSLVWSFISPRKSKSTPNKHCPHLHYIQSTDLHFLRIFHVRSEERTLSHFLDLIIQTSLAYTQVIYILSYTVVLKSPLVCWIPSTLLSSYRTRVIPPPHTYLSPLLHRTSQLSW